MAMSMWARQARPGQPGSGAAGTAPSAVRRSRAYCAGARCAPIEFVTIGEGQARIMLLGNAERRWASTVFIGIKTYKRICAPLTLHDPPYDIFIYHVKKLKYHELL